MRVCRYIFVSAILIHGGYMESLYMEKLYRLFPWPENPYEEEGRARYQEALEYMARVVEHGWIRERVGDRDRISIVEYCSGTGIGGIALARILREKYGVAIDLLLIDLRRSALEIAKRFSREELGFEVDTLVADVTKDIDLGKKFDIALLWGLTTPHFSPWNYIKFLSNVARSLSDKGIYIYEEGDRMYSILLLRGYKDVVSESSRNRIVLTIHRDYSPLTGYITRTIYDFIGHEYTDLKLYFWGLADSMAFTWIFFRDIDFIPLRSSYSGVAVAVDPRRDIRYEDYLYAKPRVLEKEDL
ncbi:methyltransferase type 12 [Ignisphaera aggregans DSM 17230]|uniref:Methyltransferase type 12 n=1 Tax=Ignisphaera aggregans (strain DSM 17230 / JCM 13409 / AQ1.S1) TaxID=583356 RepID=E0SSS8_IGNAA|nr:methyltransferase type 12 [Ignisphaera aggregans DSM 17230]